MTWIMVRLKDCSLTRGNEECSSVCKQPETFFRHVGVVESTQITKIIQTSTLPLIKKSTAQNVIP